MSEINLKLKTYEQLQFEITKLNTDIFLKGQEIERLHSIIKEVKDFINNNSYESGDTSSMYLIDIDKLLEIDLKGKLINTDHYEAVIKSKHRMTYSNVNKIIEDNDPVLIRKYNDIYEMLINMNELSKLLYINRIKRGSFDFETNEAKLILDSEGKTIDILLRERKSAEKLIEEFMLLANESVAEKMTWLDVPFIYRVHDEPDEARLNVFMSRLKTLKQDFSFKNILKATFVGVLTIHIIGIIYMLFVVLIRQEGWAFIKGWILAQSVLKIAYDLVLSFGILCVAKYGNKFIKYLIL